MFHDINIMLFQFYHLIILLIILYKLTFLIILRIFLFNIHLFNLML